MITSKKVFEKFAEEIKDEGVCLHVLGFLGSRTLRELLIIFVVEYKLAEPFNKLTDEDAWFEKFYLNFIGENTMENVTKELEVAEQNTKHEAIREDKQFRKELDENLQRIKGSQFKSAEKTLAFRKLQECIHWLGEDLKEIGGTPNPYPNSKDPSNVIVDPTADGLKL